MKKKLTPSEEWNEFKSKLPEEEKKKLDEYQAVLATYGSKCTHQFFKIADEVKREGEMVPTPVRWGIKIMCATCGQRRILWTDGEVETL